MLVYDNLKGEKGKRLGFNYFNSFSNACITVIRLHDKSGGFVNWHIVPYCRGVKFTKNTNCVGSFYKRKRSLEGKCDFAFCLFYGSQLIAISVRIFMYLLICRKQIYILDDLSI